MSLISNTPDLTHEQSGCSNDYVYVFTSESMASLSLFVCAAMAVSAASWAPMACKVILAELPRLSSSPAVRAETHTNTHSIKNACLLGTKKEMGTYWGKE